MEATRIFAFVSFKLRSESSFIDSREPVSFQKSLVFLEFLRDEFANGILIFVSLLNYKRTAISWYLRKQVGVIAYPMYLRLRRFPASQEDKYRDKKK